MPLAVRFRDDFVADDEEHGAGGEAQTPGGEQGGAADDGSAGDGAQGFDKAGSDAQQGGEAWAIAYGQQRGGYDKDFGYVLDGDANDQAFGQVVQDDRKYKEPGTAQLLGMAGITIA